MVSLMDYNYTELKEALKEGNELLRSAYAIAERKGEATNWDTFKDRLRSVLTRQHGLIYPVSEFKNPCKG